MLLVFGVSEIIVFKLIDIAGHVFYGFERHAFSGFFFSLHSFIRMLFAGLFFALVFHNGELLQIIKPYLSAIPYFSAIHFSDDRLEVWAWFHLIAGLATFLIVFWITVRQIGWPTVNLKLAMRELKIGIFYSIGISARSVYTNIDKSVLARFASPEINGAYTAAFRLIYMAFAPVEAVLRAANARFFREGSKGVDSSFRMATKIVLYGSLYCLLFALAVFIGAPLIPIILGKSYVLSTEILRWLALLPVVILLQDAYSDALTGADRQKVRSFFQVIVALTCFGLNMLLVPRYSWLGSVAATYISQMILAIFITGLIVYLVRKERKQHLVKM
jgi:O-antigen/teichoic acid export membrane protein